MNYTYVTNYKDDNLKRASFNALTNQVFGFDFEDWYQKGFWGDKYIPHSLMDQDKIIANISVSLMDYTIGNTKKRYVQLGTVMTDKDYRGQGLGRWLMERVLTTYKDQVEAIYLFGNDSVLDYYTKFGFCKSLEYRCERSITSHVAGDFVKIQDPSKEDQLRYLEYIKKAVPNDGMFMDNYGLMTFWTAHMNNIYYSPSLDAYVDATVEDNILHLNAIVAPHQVDVHKVIDSFGHQATKAILGFTPRTFEGFDVHKYHEEDCTLFYIGDDLKRIEKDQLRFPVHSHA